MPIADKVQNREYQREWARKRRAGLPTRTIPILSSEERKRHRKEAVRRCTAKLKKKMAQKRSEVFGDKCVICNSERSLQLHNIFGENHDKANTATKTTKLALKHPEKWRLLCYACHKGVHWIMRYFGWTWEEILSHLSRTP